MGCEHVKREVRKLSWHLYNLSSVAPSCSWKKAPQNAKQDHFWHRQCYATSIPLSLRFQAGDTSIVALNTATIESSLSALSYRVLKIIIKNLSHHLLDVIDCYINVLSLLVGFSFYNSNWTQNRLFSNSFKKRHIMTYTSKLQGWIQQSIIGKCWWMQIFGCAPLPLTPGRLILGIPGTSESNSPMGVWKGGAAEDRDRGEIAFSPTVELCF